MLADIFVLCNPCDNSLCNGGAMRVKYFLTTLRGLESLVASRLREKAMGEVHLWERFPGILLLISEASMENILDAAYEIERATPIYRECRATLDEIVSNGIAVAREHLNPTEKFAVRTQRRGQHEFTSQDVNQRLGAAIVEVLGNPVELTYPDKIIRVEIVSEWVGIGVDTARAHKYLGKHDVRELLHRISVIQMPYTGEGADRMGIDIGRAAQTFEIREYIVAPSQPIPLSEVMPFLE
ncbi:MAG TPA: hypothetical protein EYP10_09410, partial [Armatimonadetes bacterium]|nr:hypothetical protein [Armatimonadota bacterium]